MKLERDWNIRWIYLASNVNAMIPAASGAEADVPLNSSVHWWYKSVVT